MTTERLQFLKELMQKEQALSMTGCFFKSDADDIIFLIEEEMWYEKQRRMAREKDRALRGEK